MVRRYDIITELYNRTARSVTSSPQNWKAFLSSACYNFRLRFDEQLLVYAQRPDARAVLEIERWNENFGRWVNKGARGIAVFEDADRSRQRVAYYFDISDTHPSKFSRPVPIWEMKPEYTEDVIETLESTFGELEDKSSIEKAILSAAKNAAEDNLADYIADFKHCGANSDIEHLSAEEAYRLYVSLSTDSIAFMTMSRLGLDAESSFEKDAFDGIANFNSVETLNAIGFATSDIAEMGLAEISKTIISLEKENRIIAEKRKTDYNADENKRNERSNQNERTDLHDAGRLPNSRTDNAGTERSDLGPIRTDEKEVSETDSQSSLLQSPHHLQDERASDGSRAESDGNGRTTHQGNDGEGRIDRADESDGYDGLGSQNKQHQEHGAGDSNSQSDSRLTDDDTKPLPSISEQLNHIETKAEEKTSAFAVSQEDIDSVLQYGSIMQDGKIRIYLHYQEMHTLEESVAFLKKEYGQGGCTFYYPDGTKGGMSFDGKGIHIEKHGNFAEPDMIIPWKKVSARLNELINADRYLNQKEKDYLPQYLERKELQRIELELASERNERLRHLISFIDIPIEDKKDSLLERLTAYLNDIQGYEKHLAESFGLTELLSKRQEDVAAYMNEPKNKANLIAYIDKVAGSTTDAYIRNLAYSFSKELKATLQWEYVYHLGDTVYIGASEYELLSFDDDRVLLYDTEFPMFNKEMSRAEFDTKVQENPMNEHLKIIKTRVVEPERISIYDHELDVLLDVLYALKIDDIELNIDNNCIVATDGDSTWRGAELYEFLVEEAFVFETGGSVLGIDEELLMNFTKLSERNGVPVNNTRIKQPYRGYLDVKAENPDSIVLYQVGDFYEAFNDDAKIMADAIDLTITSRSVTENERVPMVGVPHHRLSVYTDMLLSRGYDVTLAPLTDGERKTYLLRSNNKEDPVETKPIGRIDYLHTDGRVRESIEYTSPYKFEKDIKEENHYGVPMIIVFYKGKDGKSIPDNFLSSLDPPPQGIIYIDSPYLNKTLAERLVDFYKDYDLYDYRDSLEAGDTDEDAIKRTSEDLTNPDAVTSLLNDLKEIATDTDLSSEQKAELEFLIKELTELKGEPPTLTKAKEHIDGFCRKEYEREDGADYSDLSKVNVAYTTTEDEKHEIQANINLVDFRIETYIDDTLIRSEQFESLEDMNEKALPYLSFDELVFVLEDELAKIENANEPLTPPWEQEKKSKVKSFILHPEIPMSDRHNFDLKNHVIEEAGKKERFRRNMDAINVLKNCELEDRFATPEEQEILSKYVGWGGIPEAFDDNNASWANEFTELYTALSPEEYSSARASTLTAFYTPPAVIQAVYKAMEQMGFREGNILEPSCGIGHFIGMMPDSMKDSKIYGVELDTISAGIAQQLYQKTSIAAQPFEEANLPDSFFDAVVGNVPFGDFKVSDKKYDKHKFLIHDYFFAKSLDKLRPSGVMALITSKGTMDKENPAVRKYIAQRADLLGAIRLPNNTFKGNAGTEVVSDILILQKRDRLIDIEPDWVHLGKDENGITMNSYFVKHPEMVLGEMKMASGRFGPEPTCEPIEGSDLGEQLAEAIVNIHGEIADYEFDEELAEEDNSIPADPNVRNFSYTVFEDRIYFRENSRMMPVDMSATAENRIKCMIAIRDSVRNLIELQTEDYPDSDIKAEQENLNKLYDDFTKKYGLINSRANTSAFSQDSSFSLLSALEILADDGTLERKADMFHKRTIKPHTPVTSVDTSSEALAVSMGEKACVDMEYMMQLSGKTEEEIYNDLKGVIFLNPLYEYGGVAQSKYLMADEYLSGNVREKLATAKRSALIYPEDYKVNVEALEKVQPKDLTASEISVRLGSTWLPTDVIEQFIYEFLDPAYYRRFKIKVHFSEYTGDWNIEGKSEDRGNIKAYSTYGTTRINAYKIIEETLNLKDVRIFDYVEDDEGKKKPVLNKKETAIAQAKQELIKQGFQDWIWADPKRRERLSKIYNEKFNSIRPREYDGSHITFNGMNPEIELREHQRNAVAHILYGGNTLLAHAVGAGKTFEMTAAAMESKRLGLCSKSMFVVPNHLTEQWAGEFLQLYPSANILVATKKDFEKKNRKRFCGRIATGDYDAIIIGHSQFEKIPMSIERQCAILEQQLEEVTNGIAELKRQRGDKFSVKQLERTKKSLKIKLDKLNDQSRKDDVVTFEELGVDRLFIDESHYYKNLFLYTKMRNVGGIAQTEAQKSSDLFMKCRYLDEITGGRGTVFATGTPISNSMVELYTIQRYLQYNTLVKNGLQHFDSWASTFGETVTAIELSPEGMGYRAKTRFAKFHNLPELMSMFKEVADIQTADMLHLPVPKANFHNVSVKPSEMQKVMVADLAERAEKVRNKMVDSSVDNMLKITNDGRKLALDQRMINPNLPDFEGSKLNACVDNIYRIWEEGKEKYAAQLFFCDLSTPKSDGTFSVYNDIRKKLNERGIPESEIRFIHDAYTEAKKLDLFKKTRKGEVRLLMGSTQKMGAGTNVQNKLIALHDLDCPWRPSDLEQRLGRIIRQGNENLEVDIYRYVTEETFDAYLYQLVEGKQKFASQIMTSKSPVRSAEDIDETALSYAEIKMLATGNPYIKEKMDLDIQVQKLRLLKSNFLSEKYALEDKIIKFYPQEIARRTNTINGLKADIERTAQHPKPIDDTFVGMTVSGVFYSEKADAGKAIIEVCQSLTNPDPIPLGDYRGFTMDIFFDTMAREYVVRLKGEMSYSVSLGADIHGNITRIDNVLEGLPKRLANAELELDNVTKQFETAQADVEKPFIHENELNAKTTRLNELNALLNVDKRENEIVDGEPEEGDEVPEPKKKEQIR